jgi:hypothetical protein
MVPAGALAPSVAKRLIERDVMTIASLMGANSPLFENMEWLDQYATDFAQGGKAGARALAARAKKLSELAGGVGQAFTKAGRSTSH